MNMRVKMDIMVMPIMHHHPDRTEWIGSANRKVTHWIYLLMITQKNRNFKDTCMNHCHRKDYLYPNVN